MSWVKFIFPLLPPCLAAPLPTPSRLPLRVLVSGLDEAGVEEICDADGDVLAAAKGRGAARRAAGNMGAMSGGAGLSYLEFGSGPREWGEAANKGRAGGGVARPGVYQGEKARAMGRKLLGGK